MAVTFPYNQYSETAQLYDLDNRAKTIDDIAFYVDHSIKGNGDVLELCCGTGRVTIPIAKASINVTGLDVSAQMLDVFQTKIDLLPTNVRDRITIVKADMTDFDLHRKFKTIIIPFSSFQGLCLDVDIDRCLTCVYDHLEEEGTFVVHCFRPLEKLDESWITTSEVETVVLYDKDGSIGFRRTGINKSLDMEAQIIFSDAIFYNYEEGKIVSRKVEHLKLHYYYPDQLISLLEDKGFTILEKYGYYDKRDLYDPSGAEMIMVCGKST